MKRRDFLKKTGQAVTLAVITGGTGLLFHNRETTRYMPPIVKSGSFEVPPDPTLPGIALATGEDHIKALHAALDAIGGIKRFINPGERITIKPNIGWDRSPRQAATTNPVLVSEMVRLCLEIGASEVIVTDVTCNDPRRCFLRSGIRQAAENAGARVILPVDEDYVKVDLKGEILTVWPVLKYFINTDKLINMPIVKQHSLTSCTIGMKNLYGILGGQRHRLHQSIDQSIVDLAAFCRPTLTIVDATRVLFRNGPQGGSLHDVKIRNTVICSTDQVASDTLGAGFLDLMPERVRHIMLAEKQGLGTADYKAIGFKEIV